MNVETYSLSEAAKAAQVDAKVLRRWMTNGAVRLRGPDRHSTGSGVYCGLSRRRAIQAAIMRRLLSAASTAALMFSDTGQTGRSPGELFSQGKTVLAITDSGATVQNLQYDTSLADISNGSASIILIDLDRVVAQVDAAL
jgi:hypothetical protein